MAIFCPNCGMRLEENSNFCGNCGLQITQAIPRKKNMKLVVAGLIIMIIGIVIVVYFAVTIQNSNNNPLSNLGYSNTTYGFGLNPPAGWTTNTSGSSGAIVSFFAPNNIDNINIVPGQLPTGMSLENYIISEINSYDDSFADTLLSNNTRTVNGMNAYEYVFTYTVQDYNIELKMKQVAVEKNSNLIILTYTAIPEDYDIYYDAFESSVNSLRII